MGMIVCCVGRAQDMLHEEHSAVITWHMGWVLAVGM